MTNRASIGIAIKGISIHQTTLHQQDNKGRVAKGAFLNEAI
ncbi:hypothetical protein NIES2104_01700 [Leptolyngbya sp. NIES-2104]|nr:hypothetical protein NIES2104_01700 [Leptolyngbya sp. NIES-2104]